MVEEPDVRAAEKWTAVLEAEYQAIYGTPAFPDGGPTDPDDRLRELHRLLHARRPTAVCLSGGGIRSATFGLGVLQGLAKCGVLGRADYLSTVSGGGYVGGWLTAWIRREGAAPVLRTLGEAASHVGPALAVSGAAASPAMGIYSSKARAFLLTLANARLGLWFGNPSDPVTWRHSEPSLGVGPLVRELLGLETGSNPYVYLSDGGHFENLGLWAMVQRRCAVIILSDAGCDPDYTFDDLSNAIRRIRLDLWIPIDFGPLGMSQAGQGHGNAHAAIGTIHYSVVDGEGVKPGTLLYVKATLSGDEPLDVANFAAADPAFPHDSTSDQFFSEARFESYRALGSHSIETFAGELKGADAAELCALVGAARGTPVFAPVVDAHV